MKELIDKQREYIKFLGERYSAAIIFCAVHGMTEEDENIKKGERLRKEIQDLEAIQILDDEPYFGWCDVDGCEQEGCSGGNAWSNTGYWTVCRKHSQDNRDGKPQPKMKQVAIDREKGRDPETGYLKPPPKKRGGCDLSK